MSEERATQVGADGRELTPLGHQLLGVAGHVANLRRGPRAVLRRLRGHAGSAPPAEFWRVVDKYELRRADEDFWLAVLPLLVECPHAWTPPGQALARSGVSQTRVERWLRLDRERAWREANRLLARVDGGLDWTDFGQLLFDWGDEDRQRSFARQFFLSPALRERER